jgi:hypothetical protein
MSKFIEVKRYQYSRGSGRTEKFLVNVDDIVSVSPFNDYCNMFLRNNEKEAHVIAQSFESVKNLIES